jgi:hypothetical protein
VLFLVTLVLAVLLKNVPSKVQSQHGNDARDAKLAG